MKKVLACLLILFLNVQIFSVCCGPPFGGHIHCPDGSWTWTCCGSHSGGYGGCNIFCCNCTGGCRKAHTYQQCIDQCGYWEDNCENDCALGGDPPHCRDACSRGQEQCEEGCRGLPETEEEYKKMMAERDPVTVRLQNIAQAVLHFAKVDSDDSTSIGVITKKEMIDFFDGHPCINASEEFDKLNKNKDGCITLDEIDDISKDDLKALQAIGGSPYIKAALEARPAPKKQESKKKEPAKKATKKKK